MYKRNLRNRPVFFFGGDGGIGGGEPDFGVGELVGGIGLTFPGALGLKCVGGAVGTVLPGDGGMSGIFSGGIVFSVVGVAGVKLAGDTEGTGPGGAGVGPLAI